MNAKSSQKSSVPRVDWDPVLEQRWRHWPLLAGVLALVVYLLTLAPGAYPGISATLLASVSGAIPEHPAGHPVWFLLTHGIAQLHLLDLPLRLNLFSAICGAGAVALFGWLVSWFLFVNAREDAGGSARAMSLESDEAEPPRGPVVASITPGVESHNRQLSLASLLGGCVAALTLAFCAPFWSACTRFGCQTFDLLLLLVILLLIRSYLHARRPNPVAALIAFLCGLGSMETEIFIPLSALLIVLYTVHLARRRKSWDRLLPTALFFAGVGAGAGLLLLFLTKSTAPGMPTGIRFLASGLLHAHYQALKNSLPHTGWFWILLLAILPAVISLSTARNAFANRDSLARLAMNQLFTIATLICLFNADSISPWALARDGDYLPVLPYLAVAAVAGYLAAYWRLLGAPDDIPPERTEDGNNKHLDRLGKPSGTEFWRNLAPSLTFRRIAGIGVTWLILVLVCIFPLVNLRDANGRASAFADRAAREVLAQFGDRDWIAGGGPLDRHIQLAARMQGRTLRMISSAGSTDSRSVRQLQAWVAADPVFRTQRESLNTAASFGVQTFFLEWLKTDRSAETKLVTLGSSAIWKRAGWQPVPLGIGYGGVAHAETLHSTDLLQANRAFWARMDQTLAPATNALPLLDYLRRSLRWQISRTANDLGVLLQDQGRNEDAYEAYQAAWHFNANNLSAVINLFFLTESGVHKEKTGEIKTAISDLLAQSEQAPAISRVVEICGEIRNADALTSQGHDWSLRGQPVIARNEFKRALTLGHGGAQKTELQLASFFLTQGDTNRCGQIYRTLLAANPADARALVGLAAVALIGGRTGEAQHWLDQARAAGATPDALALCNASLLVQTGKLNEGISLLQAITDRHPENIEAWSLQADALFRRKNFKEIEQRILPGMWKALGKRDHVLIHILRAKLFSEKTPPDFALARVSYLHALALRPDLIGVRNDLLLLDLATSDLANMETDGTMVFRADPDDALANYLLAAVALERGDFPRAETFFRRSFAAQKIPGALNDFAELLRRQKRFAEAEKAVREALALSDKLYQAWDTLGRILLDAGKPDEAAKAAEQALALCQTDPRLHVSLATIRFAQGRTDEARRILRDIPVKFPSIPAVVKTEMAALEQRLSRSASTTETTR